LGVRQNKKDFDLGAASNLPGPIPCARSVVDPANSSVPTAFLFETICLLVISCSARLIAYILRDDAACGMRC